MQDQWEEIETLWFKLRPQGSNCLGSAVLFPLTMPFWAHHLTSESLICLSLGWIANHFFSLGFYAEDLVCLPKKHPLTVPCSSYCPCA